VRRFIRHTDGVVPDDLFARQQDALVTAAHPLTVTLRFAEDVETVDAVARPIRALRAPLADPGLVHHREHDVFFVDWPHARVGAPWLDLAYFLPSVAMQGGPLPDEVFWGHPLARFAQRQDVSSVLAGLAGFMIHSATQPPPPGIPNLRSFQLAQGQQAVRWLRKMTSVERPS
jgi:hypothetical protein